MLLALCFLAAHFAQGKSNSERFTRISTYPSLDEFSRCYLGDAFIFSSGINVRRYFHLDSRKHLSFSGNFPNNLRGQVVGLGIVCGPPVQQLNFRLMASESTASREFQKRSARMEKVLEVSESSTGVLLRLGGEEDELYHFLEPIPEDLEMDPLLGQVSLRRGQTLDFETTPEVTFAVAITRIDDPSYYETQSVTLRILDENDEKPQFLNLPHPFLAVVSSNAPPGTSVFQLIARDEDDLSEVNYFAESGEDRFEVDPQSGVVRTRGNDPFPPGKEFELGVFAADVAASPPQNSPTESLKILVGTRPPQFHQSFYEAFVPESSEERHEIIRVVAHSHSLNPVSYELSQSGDQSSDFAIDQTTGTVDLLKRLDFDTGPHKFLLAVKAIDHSRPPLTSTVELVVNLLDVNDNHPTFPLSQYVIQDVAEDAPIGTKIMAVTASDLDSGENSRLSYVVDDDRFSLEHINNTAIIKTAKPLDYDFTDGHTYSFVVTAIDHGSPRLTGSANVRVSVRNVNDLQPTFSHSVEYVQVSEEASLGVVIHVLQAYDVDGDMVTYGFEDGSSTSGPFSVSPDSGIITLSQVPDKRISSYQLNVSVHDDGSCCGGVNSLSSTGLVVVEIKDVNNNAPKFLECSSYNPVVMERENIGTFVIKVTATDLDKGINSNLTYSLVRFGEQSSFDRFEIDPKTGIIVTADVLDRESKIGVTDYGLTVKAEDHGSPSLAGFCSFRIKVGDKNDNPPIFSMLEYWVSVEESSPIGKKVKQVYATDRDAGKNSMVEYFIKKDSSGMGLFYLHPATGWLDVVGSLFGQRKVVLDIVARDMGDPPKSSEAKIVVEVLAKVVDMPQWMEDYSKSTIFVDENVPVNHPVKRFKAVSSLNISTPPMDLLLNYFIAPGENPEQNGPPITFYHRHDEVTNEMILLTYRTLDYETIPRYTLTIKAASRAMHSRHVDMQVLVEVKDSNDEIPQFVGLDENGRYSTSVAENLRPGVEVVQVTATDKDEFEDFKMITYEIKALGEDHKMFTINSTSGTITTLHSFDREAKNEYYLTLLAKDGAPSSRSNHYPPGTPNQGEAELQIRILDVNDNAPYFQQQEYKARIPENADVGTVVIIVTAEDKDEENILTYSITSGNHGRVFEVVPETGEVKVRGHLDYESGPKEYKLTYRVFDEKLANTTVIVIEVIDVNDNAPVFEQSVYTVEDEPEEDHSISRKNPKLLLTVRATDVDSPFPQGASDSHIRYGLTGQFTEDDTFTINEVTGQIYLTTPLNRDPPQGRPVWNFNVLAYDESLTGYAEVKVHLSDVNDNPPVFDPSRLSGKVPEHSPPGHRVMTVMTSDNDSGLNASVTYSLRHVPRLVNVPIFSINHQTGLIVTMVDDLDREKVSEYQFLVVATDRGTPPLSATTTVTVVVEDINDHIPRFQKKFYYVEIQENLPAGSSVLSLSAIDMDIGINARLFYSLQVPEDRHYFTISNIEATNSGVIRIHKEVDFEGLPDESFNLTVRVEDIDSSHFDLSFVHVKILDSNDNPPLIAPIHHKTDVHENVSIGTQLFKFSASDPDTESGGMFRFYIDKKSDPENMFRVSTDGVVRTFNYLDREKKPEHRINIMCIDEGYPRLTSFATLVVSLIDINDNAPHIITSVVPVLYENQPAGQLVTEVTPEDLDAHHNGPPFKIWLPCSGDCPCPDNPSCSLFDFKFIPDGGKNRHGSALISSSKPLDREASKYHLLPIVLSDSGSPPMFGTSTLTICVGDVNDNLHRSAHKTISALTSSGQNEDVPLGMAFAEDPDDWDVVDKTFTFVEEESHEMFRLNSTTGQLFSRGKLKAGSHRLLVRISDVQWKHEVVSTVQVDVSFLSDSTLSNRASLRLRGTTSIGFITKNPSVRDGPGSLLERFCGLFSKLLGVPREEVFVVSIKDRGLNGVDVVFSLHGVHRTSPEKVHGIVALRRREIEETLGLRVSMSPIDECQGVNDQCLSSGCHTISKIGGATNLVDANSTSFVGLDVQLEARCSCSSMPLQLQEVKSCFKLCLNGGRCVDRAGLPSCSCPEGFNGPRCQLNVKSFSGDGWAWLRPFSLCSRYHISVEILTNEEQGTILYQGPLIFDSEESAGQSFLFMRLENGLPVVEMALEGVKYVLKLEANDGNALDGRWHRIDLYLSVESMQLVLDKCLFQNTSPVGGSKMQSCETNVYLDYDSRPVSISFGLNPLQVGGVYSPLTPPHKGFNGCIRNLMFNDELYDMFVSPTVGMQQNVKDACKEGHDLCNVGGPLECSRHSCGVLTQGELLCQCPPGLEGRNCSTGGSALDLGKDSYVEWELSDEIHATLMTSAFRQSTSFHLMFRTRQPTGMLFRVNNNHKSKFISAELVNQHLVAVFNFNGWKKKLSLPHVNVSDGAWHSVTLSRERSWLELKLDWGEGVYVNSSFSIEIKTSPFVIGRFGLVAGGNVKKPSFLDAPLVESDFRNGCLKDIRINGHHLPMKLWESNKVASMVPGGEQVSEGCHDVDLCPSVTCSPPLDCVSLWRHAECGCLRGRLTSDGKRCDHGDQECTEGESCYDSVSCEDEPCICDVDDVCHSVTEELAASKTTKLLLFVFLSIVFFILLALSALLTFHVKSKKKKNPSEDNYVDVRESIVHYDEEGVGERDERNYSISQLNCPGDDRRTFPVERTIQPPATAFYDPAFYLSMGDGEPCSHLAQTLGDYLARKLQKVDNDPNSPPFESVREYCYEGQGSLSGSFSSLGSEERSVEPEESV